MFSLLESALCLWIQVHPLWIQGLKRSVLWTQNITLLEGQGLWIQAIVLHCSCAKAASQALQSGALALTSPSTMCAVCIVDHLKTESHLEDGSLFLHCPPCRLSMLQQNPHHVHINLSAVQCQKPQHKGLPNMLSCDLRHRIRG